MRDANTIMGSGRYRGASNSRLNTKVCVPLQSICHETALVVRHGDIHVFLGLHLDVDVVLRFLCRSGDSREGRGEEPRGVSSPRLTSSQMHVSIWMHSWLSDVSDLSGPMVTRSSVLGQCRVLVVTVVQHLSGVIITTTSLVLGGLCTRFRLNITPTIN